MLYLDLMFDLDHIKNLEHNDRERNVAEKITIEVPEIIAKYKLKDFDLLLFAKDLKQFFEKINWL
jgi:hypothetical protein